MLRLPFSHAKRSRSMKHQDGSGIWRLPRVTKPEHFLKTAHDARRVPFLRRGHLLRELLGQRRTSAPSMEMGNSCAEMVGRMNERRPWVPSRWYRYIRDSEIERIPRRSPKGKPGRSAASLPNDGTVAYSILVKGPSGTVKVSYNTV